MADRDANYKLAGLDGCKQTRTIAANDQELAIKDVIDQLVDRARHLLILLCVMCGYDCCSRPIYLLERTHLATVSLENAGSRPIKKNDTATASAQYWGIIRKAAPIPNITLCITSFAFWA